MSTIRRGVLGHDRAVDVAAGRGLDRVPARPERQGHEPVRLDGRQVDRVRTSAGFRVGERPGPRFLDVRLELARPDAVPGTGAGRVAAEGGANRIAKASSWTSSTWSVVSDKCSGWNVDVDSDSPMARTIASRSCQTEATTRSPSSLEPWRPTWTSTSPGSFRRSGSISVRRVRSNSPWAGRKRNRRMTEPVGQPRTRVGPSARRHAARVSDGVRAVNAPKKRDAPRWDVSFDQAWEDQADGLASGLAPGW